MKKYGTPILIGITILLSFISCTENHSKSEKKTEVTTTSIDDQQKQAKLNKEYNSQFIEIVSCDEKTDQNFNTYEIYVIKNKKNVAINSLKFKATLWNKKNSGVEVVEKVVSQYISPNTQATFYLYYNKGDKSIFSRVLSVHYINDETVELENASPPILGVQWTL